MFWKRAYVAILLLSGFIPSTARPADPLAEDPWSDIGREHLATLVKNNAAEAASTGQGYCSGFHCYHYSIDQCQRLGAERCRSVEVLRSGDHSGHALNLVREVVSLNGETRTVYCLFDPQGGGLKRESCYSQSFKDSEQSGWKGPSAEMYCRVFAEGHEVDDYCNADHTPKAIEFRLSTSENLAASGPFSGWWANAPRADSQLFEICANHREMKRARADMDPLPKAMPECDAEGLACASTDYLQACRQVEWKGTNCQVYACLEGHVKYVRYWDELKLPRCDSNADARDAYCRESRHRVSAELVGIKNFDLIETRHHCAGPAVAGSALATVISFKCQSKGPRPGRAAGAEGIDDLVYDWEMPESYRTPKHKAEKDPLPSPREHLNEQSPRAVGHEAEADR